MFPVHAETLIEQTSHILLQKITHWKNCEKVLILQYKLIHHKYFKVTITEKTYSERLYFRICVQFNQPGMDDEVKLKLG